MTLYLTTLILTLSLAFIADTTITICPFSITFARPLLAAGIILVMGLVVVRAIKKESKIKEKV
jgi:hypothetical protein